MKIIVDRGRDYDEETEKDCAERLRKEGIPDEEINKILKDAKTKKKPAAEKTQEICAKGLKYLVHTETPYEFSERLRKEGILDEEIKNLLKEAQEDNKKSIKNNPEDNNLNYDHLYPF